MCELGLMEESGEGNDGNGSTVEKLRESPTREKDRSRPVPTIMGIVTALQSKNYD